MYLAILASSKKGGGPGSSSVKTWFLPGVSPLAKEAATRSIVTNVRVVCVILTVIVLQLRTQPTFSKFYI